LDDPQLSQTAKRLIEDPTNEVEISPASYSNPLQVVEF
jgi:PIN domain nuclease of toxin-antitoxin system